MKKLLSIVLSLAMILAMIPMTTGVAFAAETPTLGSVFHSIELNGRDKERVELLASIMGDSPKYAECVVEGWLSNKDLERKLNACTEYLGTKINSEVDPVEYSVTKSDFRLAKDLFYVEAFVLQYVFDLAGRVDYSTVESPSWSIRCVLDHIMELKESMLAVFDNANASTDEDMGYFAEVMLNIIDSMNATISDTFTYYYVELDSPLNYEEKAATARNGFYKDMRSSFNKKSISAKIGTDNSLNEHAACELYAKGFCKLNQIPESEVGKYVDTIDEWVYEGSVQQIFGYNGFLDENDNVVLAKKVGLKTMLTALIELRSIVEYKYDNKLTTKQAKGIVSNYGPLVYKILDLLNAVEDDDTPNIYILAKEVSEDTVNLLRLCFEINDGDEGDFQPSYYEMLEEIRGKHEYRGCFEFFDYDVEQFIKLLAEAQSQQSLIDVGQPVTPLEAMTSTEVKALLTDFVITTRTENQARGIKVYVNENEVLNRIAEAGYTITYDFYNVCQKAVPTNAQYKITKVVNKAESWYLNTAAKKGNKYYYKVIAKVLDTNGNLVAETTLDQCKYGCRTRK